MNEIINTILNRRSVRVYSGEQLKDEHLDLILKCAEFSPSGCNMQPWHFTIVQNKELMCKLNTDSKKEFADSENELFRKMAANEKYDIFYDAPTVIVVSGEKSSQTALIDCSAATQNMILAAESLGIGSCWIGLVTFLFRSDKVQQYKDILGIPDAYEPYYALSLGYKKIPNVKPFERRENVINYIK